MTTVPEARAASPALGDAHRAGFVSRGLAFAVDFAVVLVGYPAIVWSIAIVVGLLRFEQPTYPDLEPWASGLVSAAWPVAYFTGAWVAAGRTVGQGLLGLRVIGRRHERVRVVQSFLRCWTMLLTSFVVGPLWLLVSRSRLAIHDRISHTQVVYDRAPRRAKVTVGVGVGGGSP
jgi:uncharacterized RDD family membrane protein YckC